MLALNGHSVELPSCAQTAAGDDRTSERANEKNYGKKEKKNEWVFRWAAACALRFIYNVRLFRFVIIKYAFWYLKSTFLIMTDHTANNGDYNILCVHKTSRLYCSLRRFVFLLFLSGSLVQANLIKWNGSGAAKENSNLFSIEIWQAASQWTWQTVQSI